MLELYLRGHGNLPGNIPRARASESHLIFRVHCQAKRDMIPVFRILGPSLEVLTEVSRRA